MRDYYLVMNTTAEYPVRLSIREIEAIRAIIKELDLTARIYLFGSRTDINKKGGDIDLLVLSSTLCGRDKRNIRIELCSRLGEQKFDINIAKDNSAPFVKIALQGGIEL